MKIVFVVIIFFVSVFSVADNSPLASYCVINAQDKEIVKSKDHFLQKPPASTVKLLTAMVALDHAKADAKFTASLRATGVEPTKIDMQKGEEMSCLDLITALLVHSANDAAVILAEGVAKTEDEFAKLMNEKAQKIGCQKSNFATPHGLPNKKEISCTYDLALIALETAKYPEILKILAVKSCTVSTVGGREIKLKSHNNLLDCTNPVYGKTGYTNSARNTFAGLVEISGKVYAIAVMGAPKRAIMWSEIIRILGLTSAASTDKKSDKSAEHNSDKSMSSQTISVESIQKLLKEKGYYKGEVDGISGPMTQSAIMEFQRQNGLKVDGKVGPKTWEKLVAK